MKVCEMFRAIQGEGPEIGVPTTFVRLSGCNLDCDFCDSKYHKLGSPMSVRDIFSFLDKTSHVTITGGEPTLQEIELRSLMRMFDKSTHFSLETNGTKPTSLPYHTIVVSPKKQSIRDDVLKLYTTSDKVWFKFVYENKDDVWWEDVISRCNIPNNRVYIMPEGKTREEQLERMPEVLDYCLEKGYRVSPRLQVLVYDNRRGV